MEEEVDNSTLQPPPLANPEDSMEDRVDQDVDADNIFMLQESSCQEGMETHKHMEEEVDNSSMEHHGMPNCGESIEDHVNEEVNADNMFLFLIHCVRNKFDQQVFGCCSKKFSDSK